MDAGTLTTAIHDLILEAAPERKKELGDLWEQFKPQFDHAADKPGFQIEGGAFGLIPFTERTMGQVWLLGFASWRAFEAYCPYTLLCNEIVPAEMSNAPGQAEADEALDAVLAKVEELRTIDDVTRFQWPAHVLEPTATPKTVEERAVVDLLKIASAYVFLHEVRHVMFRDAGDAPENEADEEIACDRFAREFLLDQIVEYSRSSGYDKDSVSNKRLAGLAFGALILLHITSDWSGSKSHPSLALRLRELIKDDGTSPKRGAWDYVCCLLLSTLRRKGKLPSRLAFSSPNDLFTKLVELVA
jgi:hypothetical protein